MARIKPLLSKHAGRKIYIFIADGGTGKQFLQDAENEGFTFGDGAKPTEKHISDIFAVNDDLTVNYVGFVGHMAYKVADHIGDKRLVKIDYREILRIK